MSAERNVSAKDAALKCVPNRNAIESPDRAFVPLDDALTDLNDFMFLENAAFSVKHQAAVDRYVACYTSTAQFKTYRKEFRPYIQRAAKVIQVPASVLTCLLFRESSQWAGTSSHAGAIGPAQIMPVVKDDINRMLRRGAQFKELYSGALNKLRSIKRRKTIRSAKDTIFLNAEIESLKNARRLHQTWVKFWGGSWKIPKQLSDLNSARMAVAAQVVWFEHYRKLLFADTFGMDRQNGLTQLILTAAAYNLGIGGFREICGEDPTLASCWTKFPKGSETYNHIQSLVNCMTKDSYKPMTGDKENPECTDPTRSLPMYTSQ